MTLLTPSDRRVEDRVRVVEALRQGTLRSADFVDRVVPFREAPAAYAALRDHPEEHFSLVFDWTRQE